MKHHHILAMAGAALLLAACGRGKPGLAGRYQLDKNHFADNLADQLIDAGKVDAAHRSILVSKLRAANFTLDLSDDGTFRANQAVMNEKHEYIGTWELTGESIRIVQTHQDGAELGDEMTGTWTGTGLRLSHIEEGMEVQMVLHREGETPASPR